MSLLSNDTENGNEYCMDSNVNAGEDHPTIETPLGDRKLLEGSDALEQQTSASEIEDITNISTSCRTEDENIVRPSSLTAPSSSPNKINSISPSPPPPPPQVEEKTPVYEEEIKDITDDAVVTQETEDTTYVSEDGIQNYQLEESSEEIMVARSDLLHEKKTDETERDEGDLYDNSTENKSENNLFGEEEEEEEDESLLEEQHSSSLQEV